MYSQLTGSPERTHDVMNGAGKKSLCKQVANTQQRSQAAIDAAEGAHEDTGYRPANPALDAEHISTARQWKTPQGSHCKPMEETTETPRAETSGRSNYEDQHHRCTGLSLPEHASL